MPQLRRWHPEDLAVGCAVAVGILLGLSGFNHFGASWDEAQDFAYATESLTAYRSQAPDWSKLGEGDYVELHGPAYLMASELFAEGLTRLRPAWPLLDARHFNNHVIFLAGLIALYVLVRRLTGPRAALLAFALMATQPLLLGHSFINQKDAPFMALFMATIAAGFMFALGPTGNRTAGADAEQSIPLPGQSIRVAATRDWQRASRTRKVVLSGAVLAAVAIVLDVLVLNRVLWPALQTAIIRAHAGESLPWVNRLFALMAPRAAQVPVWPYVEKAAHVYARLQLPLAILALVPAWLVGRAVFPSVRIPWTSRRTWLGTGKLKVASAARLLLAASLLGVTISVRSLGLFAGGLVTLLMIRHKRPPLVGILAYWAIAALVCYATWPYLWGDPIGGFVDSLQTMAAFPWQGDILYAGRLWDAGSTPWHYLPFLIAAQITLPAFLLAGLGVAMVLRRTHLRNSEWMVGALLLLWVGVPIIAAVALQSIVYDNTRQFLFALPPLFIFAGIGLDGLWTRCRSRVMGAAVVAVLLAPGVLGILKLHPYEYAYYNALVGGTQGAFRRYETDYWCTSYREGMEQVGAVAPPGAVVAVSGPSDAAKQTARADLVIRQIDDGTDPVADQVTFGLACTRSNMDAVFYPEYAVTGEVTAAGATLAVIKDFGRPPP